jgi:ATP-dependent helicase HrpB
LPSEAQLAAREAARQHPLSRALCGALAQHRDAVLEAPTGTGKSTVVPLALLEEEWLAGRKILMLEPRRVAARAVAARMASMRGETVGATIGYRMRLDTRVSRATRVEVVTEGVLARLLQDDPALEDFGCVIFDEFHERSLQSDLGLALCLDARRQLGASFRLILMSATIEAERVIRLLKDAAHVTVPSRAFPVAVHYLGRGAPLLPGSGPDGARDAQRLIDAVARAIRQALADSSGDVLAFLPGARDIRRVEETLSRESLQAGVRVMSLFGQMSGAAQDAVLDPGPAATRKVVLATNLAETSLTIPGVTAVVDAGLVRRSRFDPGTGMSRLELERISRASSEQRCGRAGRVAPGLCYRLWSEGAHDSLAAVTPPEILDADLAPLALELARWGTTDAASLDWLDAPPPPALQQARSLLNRLGALDNQGRLNARGQQMARLPVHPRLAAMLLAAHDHSARHSVALAAQLAALLSERDLLRQGGDPDLRARLDLLRNPRQGSIDRAALDRVQRTARSLETMTGAGAGAGAAAARHREEPSDDEGVGALLAHAFPDRIGQRRDGPAARYLLSNGRGAAFAQPSSLARAPFIVAAALDDRDREARIDLAAALSEAALERELADRITVDESFGWDSNLAAVLWRRVRRFDSLVLEAQTRAPAAGSQTTAAMLVGIGELGLDALPWDQESRTLQARMEFVRKLARGDLAAWPASDDTTLAATLDQWLPDWLTGITRREHLGRLPLAEALRARLTSIQLRALELLAPRELAMPSGSQVRVDYLDDNAPCVAVRMQEVFGLAATPRIGGGTVPVTFVLLSPARRPLQITRDLAGFWGNSYVAVRKEMRGRYPKHAWPENPLEAAPTRGTGRPRRQ